MSGHILIENINFPAASAATVSVDRATVTESSAACEQRYTS